MGNRARRDRCARRLSVAGQLEFTCFAEGESRRDMVVASCTVKR